MRHSVHLMFGEDFKESAHNLKTYILKYGGQVLPYFNLLYYAEADDNAAFSKLTAKPENKDVFVSGLENKYDVAWTELRSFSTKNKNDFISDFFIQLFRETITINNPGDVKSLHLCLYIPLYKREIWEQAQKIIALVGDLDLAFQVDIIALSADMAFLFENAENAAKLPLNREHFEKTASRTLRDIVVYKQENQFFINNLLVVQNTRADGLSLDLDIASYTRIMGEFAMLCIEHYNKVFIPVASDSPVKTFGLAVLHFDSYFFVQYLLTRSYLFIMERENILQESVDIVKVSNVAEKILQKRKDFFGRFYEKEVKTLSNQNKDENEIVETITPQLDELFERISAEFQAYLSDETWSLPEKKAILATILGLDDALLSGYAYNQDSSVIEDLDFESANIFIQENNAILSYSKEERGRRQRVSAKDLLSPDDKPAYLPLLEIKEIRAKIRESATYIRQEEALLKTIKRQKKEAIESQKRLTDDGYFIFEGNKYRLLPKNLEEEFLTENYMPTTAAKKNVDLRHGFTKIKNQGKQGACTAFTMAGIYEYILKTNQADEYDLSEAFLYYNARKKAGNEHADAGSSLFDTVWALGQYGICHEEFFPYDENVFDATPPDAAYGNAVERVVKKALNVKTATGDICSALYEGYPVAVSLKIYNSFAADATGFVSRPSEEEIAVGTYGNHAMILCGYSEEEKVFIARNSWGNSFGANGYCYIPFSYIEDGRLANTACIIAEAGSGYETNGGGEQQLQIDFDIKDENIRYAILKNLIDEEKYYLSYLEGVDSKYRIEYLSLITKLRNNNLRNRLIEGTENRLKLEAADLDEEKRLAEIEKKSDIARFDKRTRKTGAIISLIVIGIWTVIGFGFYFFTVKDVFSFKPTWGSLIVSVLLVSLLFLYFPLRRRKRKLKEAEWNRRIVALAALAGDKRKQAKETRLRMHIAGMAVDRLYHLQSGLKDKYNVMSSFVGNLTTWYKEERSRMNHLDSCTKEPFIPLLSNDALDRYFDENKHNIAKNLRLYNFILSYQINEEEIRAFKQELKERIVGALYELIADFRIYGHLSGRADYKYLDKKHVHFVEQLRLLDAKSLVFMKTKEGVGRNDSHNTIFIKTDTQEEKMNWNAIFPEAFQIKPSSENLSSPTQLTLLRVLDLNLEQLAMGE